MTPEEKDELEYLRKRVGDLEGTLGISSPRYAVPLNLTPMQDKIMGLLMTQDVVSGEVFQNKLGITTDSRVAMYYLRERLAKHGIEVQSRRKVGYWLTPEAKERVRAILENIGGAKE